MEQRPGGIDRCILNESRADNPLNSVSQGRSSYTPTITVLPFPLQRNFCSKGPLSIVREKQLKISVRYFHAGGGPLDVPTIRTPARRPQVNQIVIGTTYKIYRLTRDLSCLSWHILSALYISVVIPYLTSSCLHAALIDMCEQRREQDT